MMNNKKGGVGAKIILVLILMIASAIGGAYGYRVLDGKMALKEASKVLNSVEVSDYDSPENAEVQGYIDDAKKDLETATTRKEAYEIITEFKEDISKVKTRTQKELEAAKKEAEDARNNSYNNNNNNNNNNNGNSIFDSNNNNNNNNNNNYNNNNDNNSTYNNDSNSNNNNNINDNNSSNSGNSNSNSGSGSSGSSAITNDDGTSGKPSASGILDTLLGGGDN